MSAAAAATRPIALDALGGDEAPGAPVRGALLAAADGVNVVLVGERDAVRGALRDAGASADALPVAACAGAVGMGDDPAISIRANPDASVRVAARMVAEGDASAFLSAGSTGATLAAGLLELGRLPGVRRPAVAVLLPCAGGRELVLVDGGASSDVQPEALPLYARMGAAYARVRGVAQPRVGLLNVGAEPGKGSALARAAQELLAGAPGFVGNVEPAAALAGSVDVVITDGFTGNIFLKTVEALAGAGNGAGGGPAAAAEPAGAALLLGVDGPALVAHGAADDREIAAALRTAAAVVEADLIGRLRAELSGSATSPAAAGPGAAARME